MLRQVGPISALKAGILGTVIMTIIMYSLPIIGLPPMDIMAALGSVFPFKISPYILGSLIHLVNGIALAFIFVLFFHSWLPGPNWLRGVLFSLLPWLFAITLLGPSLQLATRIFGSAPSTSTSNPCAVVNPCAPKAPANPCAVANPCAAKTPVNPCAPKGANPCAPGASSQAGIPPQILSLFAHLIYGAVLGAFYRPRAS